MPAARCARAPPLQLRIAGERSPQTAKGDQGWQRRQGGLRRWLRRCVRPVALRERAAPDG